jgi:deferrochelatase/peroxidase EfeB
LFLLFAKDPQTIDEAWERLRPSTAAASVCHLIDAYLPPDGKEHFGFRDGISQPIIRFSKRDYETPEPDRALHVVEAGEFILGYENENGRMPVSPSVSRPRDSGNRLGPLARRSRWGRWRHLDGLRDFGRNGTYLVLRQLHQDVPAFRQFLKATAGADETRQEHLAARMVGRWRSGTPLALSPDEDRQLPDEDLNRFGYFAQDSCGYRCPVGAHVRRGNPRDSTSEIDGETHALERVNFHRLLRRGRLYGPPVQAVEVPSTNPVQRGLMFLCLNADLRRQFEFVQQTWVNSNKFGGLYGEDDPLVGRGSSFTVQRPEGHERVDGLQRFVTVKGGAYFFMPGIRALQCLADPA